MMAEKQDLFAALDAQLDEIQLARTELDRREDALNRARAELEVAFHGGAAGPVPLRQSSSSARPTRAGIQQKAAQHHIDAIHDYLKKHKTARQADIAKDLQLNSGTVSLALRQLEESDDVTARDQKEKGSVVWDFAGERRSTVVQVGEGVRAGRKVAS